MCLQGLEIYTHPEPGYRPLVDYGSWRVALLNATPIYLPDGVTYFDRHQRTAEVFVLLAGSCGLLLAGQGDKPADTQCVWMEPGRVYNVLPNTWHTLYMMPQSRLAVVENRDTCIENSPRYYLTPEERQTLLPPLALPGQG